MQTWMHSDSFQWFFDAPFTVTHLQTANSNLAEFIAYNERELAYANIRHVTHTFNCYMTPFSDDM